jgi:hypothetical protein
MEDGRWRMEQGRWEMENKDGEERESLRFVL